MVCGLSCFLRVYFNLTNPTFSTGIKAQSESSGIDWSISDKLDISKTVRGVHSIRESITTVPAQQISCKNHIEKEKFISIYYLYLYWRVTFQFKWTGRSKLVESSYCWQTEGFCLPYFASASKADTSKYCTLKRLILHPKRNAFRNLSWGFIVVLGRGRQTLKWFSDQKRCILGSPQSHLCTRKSFEYLGLLVWW